MNGWVIVSKVLLPAIVAPVVAGIGAALATVLAYRITRKTPSSHSKTGFKYGQAFTACLVALAHGTSDGQKTMGVITLVLITANLQPSGTGPQPWVTSTPAWLGLGTYSGGWRIMRTLGKGVVEIETPQGAASGAASTATILASAHLGFGLSTTHVATGSILGLAWDAVAPRCAGALRARCSSHGSTLPGAGLVGGLAAILANFGTVGVIALLFLLAAACSAIWALSRHHRVSRHNVTDSREVLVLASASPTYVEDPLLRATAEDTQKPKKPKAKSVA